MRRFLLWAGLVVGAAALAFGLIALVGSFGLTGQDQADGIAGSVVVLVFGAAIFTPSLVFMLRGSAGPPSQLPTWAPPAPGLPASTQPAPVAAAAGYVPPPDLEQLYRGWYAWAQTNLDGDAVTFNAAAIAALQTGGDEAQASSAAKAAAARTASERMPGSRPAKLTRRKLASLAGVAVAVLPLLEPGERVVTVIRGTDQSQVIGWHLALGWIGQAIAATRQVGYYLVFTDRRLIALTSTQYERRPERIKFGLPLAGITEARMRWGAFGARRLTVRWDGGRLKLTIPRAWRAEAELAARADQPVLAAPV